jgi:hypothetical protein
MRYLVSERKLGLAILSFASAIFLVTKASLFVSPVLVSEKNLLLLILAIGLIAGSVYFAFRSVQKV